MIIKQDPITKLWCREDGAVLMPPAGIRFKTFRWTFGSKQLSGYERVRFHSKDYKVHQIICRAFHGLAPEDKPFVDHIDRNKRNNAASNLRWVNSKENNDNKDYVDKSIEKYGARYCDDRKAYARAYRKSHHEKYRVYDRAYRKKCIARRKALNAK